MDDTATDGMDGSREQSPTVITPETPVATNEEPSTAVVSNSPGVSVQSRPISRPTSQKSLSRRGSAGEISDLATTQRPSFSNRMPLPSIGLQSQGEAEFEDFASVTESELLGKPSWSDGESDSPMKAGRSNNNKRRQSATSTHSSGKRRSIACQASELEFDYILEVLNSVDSELLPEKLKSYMLKYFHDKDVLQQIRKQKLRMAKENTEGPNYLVARLGTGPRSRAGEEMTRSRSSGALSGPGASEPETAADMMEDTTVVTNFMYPYREEEFGVPIFELSDSDTESDPGATPVPGTSGGTDRLGTLPNVGPPQILQYVRESDVVRDRDSRGSAMTAISEHPEAGDIPDAKLTFSGNCEFCSRKIRPFPTIQQQQFVPAEELYCCQEFAQFVRLSILTPPPNTHLIDINPHPHYGGKKARTLALKKAQERAQQREMEKQLAATTAVPTLSAAQPAVSAAPPAGGGSFAFTRAMKTINFQMSSQRCHDEGWVAKPATPEAPEEAAPDPFEVEPVDWLSHSEVTEDIVDGEEPFDHHKQKQAQSALHRYYDDGAKFLTIFPDGTGSVFYPSGHLAISVSAAEKGHFTYVVYDMPDKDSSNTVKTLGVFQPNAIGCTYFSENSKLRMYYDQMGGTEITLTGMQKRKWKWLDNVTHNHAPPFQPICFAMNKYIGLRVLTQDNIAMNFLCHERSCRFNVGVKLRLVRPELLPGEDINEDLLEMAEKGNYVNELVNKMSNLLRLPRSVKADKIPSPYFVLSQQDRIRKKKKQLERVKADIRLKKERKNMRSLVVAGSSTEAGAGGEPRSGGRQPVVVVN